MVTPIRDIGRRLPQAGRIRTGKKTATGRPATLKTFRFTSSDETAIQQIAAIYGGEPGVWDAQGGDRFEVITEADEIAVALPPDPFGGTPIYEKWSGGGCERRCDGIDCEVWSQGPDGPEKETIACPCGAKGLMECVGKTRLAVILPDVRMGGLWRYDSSSANVMAEMLGFVDVIEQLQERGITVAKLRLEERVSKTPGGPTRRYRIPVLTLDASANELASGGAALGQASLEVLPPGAEPLELGAGISEATLERVRARASDIGADAARAACRRLGFPEASSGLSEEQGVAFLLDTNNEPLVAELVEENY